MDPSSVTQWIDGFKEGDPDAAAKIWRRYGGSLLSLARRKLGGTRKRVSDEEDIAMIAFEHFCLGVQQGRFAKLENRDDLWHLLVMLTKRRSLDQMRRETRRHERGESVFLTSSTPHPERRDPANLPDEALPPEIAVQAIEECSRLLEHLQDEPLRQIACWKMEGFTNDEIAERLSVATRTVERKLKIIRQKLTELASQDDESNIQHRQRAT